VSAPVAAGKAYAFFVPGEIVDYPGNIHPPQTGFLRIKKTTRRKKKRLHF
jgi:hypothetical protein